MCSRQWDGVVRCALARARIEWQKEGGQTRVGGMLKSRRSRAREQKAEMIDASETACICRQRYVFFFVSLSLSLLFAPLLLSSVLSRDFSSLYLWIFQLDTLAKFIGPSRRK